MKKTLAWILVLSFILTMLPMSALADDEYKYELEIDSGMKAEKQNGSGSPDVVVIILGAGNFIACCRI